MGEVGELAELCGYSACEVVDVEPEAGEVGELAELCGYAACEVVAAEPEAGEVGELAELCGYAATYAWIGRAIIRLYSSA